MNLLQQLINMMSMVNNIRDKINSYLLFIKKKSLRTLGVQNGESRTRKSWSKHIWAIYSALENGMYGIQILCLNLLHIPSVLGEILSLNLYRKGRNPKLTIPASLSVMYVIQALPFTCTLVRPWYESRQCEEAFTTF